MMTPIEDRLHGQRATGRTPGSAIPEWAATEIRETWNAARETDGELQAFRIIERMVDRLGYGRTESNPPLLPNAKAETENRIRCTSRLRAIPRPPTERKSRGAYARFGNFVEQRNKRN